MLQIMNITPDLAELWLKETNTHNRNPRSGKILQYARDMEHGRWKFNGDPIRFAGNFEVLLDGQQRLFAIALSKTTQRFVVISELSANTQDTMDIGANRTIGDVLSLHGDGKYVDTSRLGAVARQCLRYEMGLRSAYGGLRAPTKSEIVDYVDAHAETLRKATDIARRSERGRLPVPHATIGAAWHICQEIDAEAADVFYITNLIDTVDLSEKHPARALRRRVEEEANHRGRTTRKTITPDDLIRYAFYAWNLWRAGREVSKLQAPKGGWSRDNFPVPK